MNHPSSKSKRTFCEYGLSVKRHVLVQLLFGVLHGPKDHFRDRNLAVPIPPKPEPRNSRGCERPKISVVVSADNTCKRCSDVVFA